MHGDARGLPGLDPVLNEEFGVLEITEDAEVDSEGGPQPLFLPLPVIGLFDADADEIIDEGGGGNEP